MDSADWKDITIEFRGKKVKGRYDVVGKEITVICGRTFCASLRNAALKERVTQLEAARRRLPRLDTSGQARRARPRRQGCKMTDVRGMNISQIMAIAAAEVDRCLKEMIDGAWPASRHGSGNSLTRQPVR
jgi:hypothetical protein